MSMQVLGMSDVEIGHIQIFVVFPNRGECCWHLEWETKVSSSQMVDLALPLFYFSAVLFFYFSIFRATRVIGHAATSVTT